MRISTAHNIATLVTQSFKMATVGVGTKSRDKRGLFRGTKEYSSYTGDSNSLQPLHSLLLMGHPPQSFARFCDSRISSILLSLLYQSQSIVVTSIRVRAKCGPSADVTKYSKCMGSHDASDIMIPRTVRVVRLWLLCVVVKSLYFHGS